MDTKKHTLTEAQKQAREKANPAELKALGIRVEPAPIVTIDDKKPDHVILVNGEAVATVWLGHTHLAPIMAAAIAEAVSA